MTANDMEQTKNKVNLESEQQVPCVKLDTDTDINNSEAISMYADVPRIAWDWIYWSGTKAFDGMDFAGEVLANFLGLNESKYQWIIDAQEREEEEKQQRRLVKRQRRQLRLEQLLEDEQRKLQELEIGAREQDAALVQ
ncbi:hypothetical protein V7S43_001223 [Phytophthora oleae]|uniref:Uncharacterized protein n=1 Tax=Phytophthora oleae TaxID=2107226 RepID=A0ABD3G318_9STRA